MPPPLGLLQPFAPAIQPTGDAQSLDTGPIQPGLEGVVKGIDWDA